MTGLKRHNLWPETLSTAIAKAHDQPFEWGAHDCALFVADVILAMTGTDVADDFRGKYKTTKGAARIMKLFAGGGLPEFADKIAVVNGFKSCHPNFAQRGDVVEVKTDDGPALGICIGERIAAVGPDGMTLWPINKATRAWRVGT